MYERPSALKGYVKDIHSGDWEVARWVKGKCREHQNIMEAKGRGTQRKRVRRLKSYQWVKKGKGSKVTWNSETSRITDP